MQWLLGGAGGYCFVFVSDSEVVHELFIFYVVHIEASVIVVNEGSSFNVSCSWPVPVYQYYWNIKPKLLDTDGEGDCTESMTQYHCHVYHASLEHVGNYNITLYRIKALGASVDVQTCHVTIEVIPLNNDQGIII